MAESEKESSIKDDRKSRKRDDDENRKSRKSKRDDDDDRRSRKKHKRSRKDYSESDDSEDSRRRRRKRKKSSRRKSKKSKKSSRRKYYSSSSDDSSSSSDDSSSQRRETKKVVNTKLLEKLSQRGETMEERKERRSQKRAAKIQSRFGYTAEENPFNDPNLHEAFAWSKKKAVPKGEKENGDTLAEIDNIRKRRKDREEERDEMDRTRAEESRQKELENYDEWAKKEEMFHLDQQRKRSAIRLMEGREKPVDVLAKNLLMFGLSEEEKNQKAAVKYQERYNALEQIEKLEAELEEPHKIVGVLKLVELHELKMEIEAFRILEKEAAEGKSTASIIQYWDALHLVTQDEIKLLQNGGDKSQYARKIEGIKEIFTGQSRSALMKMQDEIVSKLSSPTCDDRQYWLSVREQLMVHLAKLDLSEMHKKMLVRQLEKLEQRKKEETEKGEGDEKDDNDKSMLPENVDASFGNDEEELGETDEIEVTNKKTYSWQDRYAPRKPRYFNRVKTGYDWNKYNQTHYDADNPPPKIVQGFSFNIFYPDLVDPTKTPQYFLEPADSDDFCILRFHGGAPYEDIAFKIINREWNRSRKRGFKCTFERGILSLYFNFTTHWYRR
ncbi:MAG: hypothetical protein SGBAC_007748 [Bacillariaceae sp.]